MAEKLTSYDPAAALVDERRNRIFCGWCLRNRSILPMSPRYLKSLPV